MMLMLRALLPGHGLPGQNLACFASGLDFDLDVN
jgi:hypothetical protein